MKIKKILAAIAGFTLIGVLLLLANSLVGNPVSKFMAKQAVKQYVEANYNTLNLTIGEPTYNFKFGNYNTHVQAVTSKDTTFSVSTDRLGRILYDSYNGEVKNRFSTWRRLSDELKEIGEDIICNKLDFDFDFVSLQFIKEQYEDRYRENLILDMELNVKNPPIPLEVNVCLFTNHVSWDKMEEVALALEKILSMNQIPVTAYSIRLIPTSDKVDKGNAVSWAHSLELSSFPASSLREEPLAMAMEEYQQRYVEELEKDYKK